MSEVQKTTSNLSRRPVKVPQEEEEQKLSYQTNKLAQFIELQLSDLQNTLHYIQKKHSINQIKESISHAYSIFSETEPVFRELRIVFVYDKIKKLVNCFSIIYLILMEHLEKPSKISVESDSQKNNDSQLEGSILHSEENSVVRRNEQNKTNENKIVETQFVSNGSKKPKPLGGVHLYNQQYNRHIESDLDRLKRKLKEQTKVSQQPSKPKISEKQKLKQQIFKQINTDIYGSPSPDELTLFFNLNSNRYGSDLQYVTFQDQLQQIATFFKQSQDEALQFLNKSRDDFIFLNFNQGFKEMMAQYKIEKEGQVNDFVGKVKILFDAIKNKTVERQNEINLQINELKKLQQKVKKPLAFQTQTQTSLNYEEEISKLKKKIQEIETNYSALQNYHNNENQNDSKSITMLEQKIAFKDHEISMLKKQIEDKNHFIDFLNEKIYNGTDHKVLRKISNIYRNHSKKNSSKIKIELEQLQKEGGNDVSILKKKNSLQSNDDQSYLNNEEKNQNQGGEVDRKQKESDMNNFTFPLHDYERPSKKKRKQGISFVGSPQKRFTPYGERSSAFNLKNSQIEQQNSEVQKSTQGELSLDQNYDNGKDGRDKTEKSGFKKDKQRNLVKADKRRSQDRSSFQMVQKPRSKNIEPKRSAFASGLNSKEMSSLGSRFVGKNRESMMNKDVFGEQIRQNLEEEELMSQFDSYNNGNESIYDYEDNQRDQYDSNLGGYDEGERNEQRDKMILSEMLKNRTSLSKNKNSEIFKNSRSDAGDSTKNIESNFNSKTENQKRTSAFLTPTQQTEFQKPSPFRRKQNSMQSSAQQNIPSKSKYFTGRNSKISGAIPPNTPFSDQTDEEVKTEERVMSKDTLSLSNQKSQDFSESQRNRRKKQFQSQDIETYQEEENSDYGDEDSENSSEDQNNDNHEMFLKTLSGSSKFDNLSVSEKDNMISTYFTTIYKEKKIKNSNLCSGLIDISIHNEVSNNNQNQNTNHSVRNGASNSGFSEDINGSNSSNQKGRSSRAQEMKDKRKNSSSGNLGDLNKDSGKLQVTKMRDSLTKIKHSQTNSQNITENLPNFKGITTNQLKQEEGENQEQKLMSKTCTIAKNHINSTDYQKIYGISSGPWNKNKKENVDFTLLNSHEKLKLEEYLEKIAIKIAMKAKNFEQFKAKIKKIHMSKCGQSCKHLERYLENFNKYQSSNRQILKVHIQNVNSSISQNNQNPIRSIKENSISLPSLNHTNGFESLKGFNSVQKPLGVVTKK